jgi:hypothetical protein
MDQGIFGLPEAGRDKQESSPISHMDRVTTTTFIVDFQLEEL